MSDPTPLPIEGFFLAKIAVDAPHALRLAAQLLGVPPCPKCDYVIQHCRCRPTLDRETMEWV